MALDNQRLMQMPTDYRGYKSQAPKPISQRPQPKPLPVLTPPTSGTKVVVFPKGTENRVVVAKAREFDKKFPGWTATPGKGGRVTIRKKPSKYARAKKAVAEAGYGLMDVLDEFAEAPLPALGAGAVRTIRSIQDAPVRAGIGIAGKLRGLSTEQMAEVGKRATAPDPLEMWAEEEARKRPKAVGLGEMVAQTPLYLLGGIPARGLGLAARMGVTALTEAGVGGGLALGRGGTTREVAEQTALAGGLGAVAEPGMAALGAGVRAVVRRRLRGQLGGVMDVARRGEALPSSVRPAVETPRALVQPEPVVRRAKPTPKAEAPKPVEAVTPETVPVLEGETLAPAPASPTRSVSEVDPTVASDYRLIKGWLDKRISVVAQIPAGKTSSHGPLKAVSEQIREGDVPPEVLDAMQRRFEPTIDMETGERLYWDNPDYPRTGTLMDFFEAFENVRGEFPELAGKQLAAIPSPSPRISPGPALGATIAPTRPVKKAPASAVGQATIPPLVKRIEEPGRLPLLPSKKAGGLYTTPADRVSPHEGIGGETHYWRTNPEAKVLRLDASGLKRSRARGLSGKSTGYAAVEQLASKDEASSLASMSRKDALAELTRREPEVDWTRYGDTDDMIDGYGGLLARRGGYDAMLGVDKAHPEFDEFVALTDQAISPAKAPTRPVPKAPAEAPSPEPSPPRLRGNPKKKRKVVTMPGTGEDYVEFTPTQRFSEANLDELRDGWIPSRQGQVFSTDDVTRTTLVGSTATHFGRGGGRGIANRMLTVLEEEGFVQKVGTDPERGTLWKAVSDISSGSKASQRGAMLNPAQAAVEAIEKIDRATRSSPVSALLRSGRSIQEGLGKSGAAISRGMRRVQQYPALAARDLNEGGEAFKAEASGLGGKEGADLRIVLGVNGLENPANANSLTAALQPVLNRIAGEAGKVLRVYRGARAQPWARRVRYWSHAFRDPEQFANPVRRQQAMEYLVRTGQAKDIAAADRLISLQDPDPLLPRRFGAGERARDFDLPGYYGDLRRVKLPTDLPEMVARKQEIAKQLGYELVDVRQASRDIQYAWQRYVHGMHRTMEMRRTFGPDNQLLQKAVQGIRLKYGPEVEKIVRSQIQLDLGLTETDEAMSWAIGTIGPWIRATKLPMVALGNAHQGWVNSTIRFGGRHAVAGSKALLTRAGWEQAAADGVLSQSFIRSVMARAGGPAVFKGPGAVMDKVASSYFLKTEEAGYVLAVNATRSFIRQNIPRAIAGNETSIRRLLELLPGQEASLEALLRAGKMPDAQTISRMAYEGAGQTMFRYTQQELPRWLAHPTGRFFLMFKQYAAQQGSLLGRHVVGEAREGNFYPLLHAALVIPVVGETIGISRAGLRALLSGDKKDLERRMSLPEDKWQLIGRILDDVQQTATLGWMGDTTQRMWEDPDRAGETLVRGLGGPVVDVATGAGQIIGSIGQAIHNHVTGEGEEEKREWLNAAREGIRQGPLGYSSQRRFLPTDKQRRDKAMPLVRQYLEHNEYGLAFKALARAGYKDPGGKLNRLQEDIYLEKEPGVKAQMDAAKKEEEQARDEYLRSIAQ